VATKQTLSVVSFSLACTCMELEEDISLISTL
jgi:hypothetical protein